MSFDTKKNDALQMVRDALGERFSTNAVRIVSDDEIAIEDDNGNDWQIIVKEPELEGEDECPSCGAMVPLADWQEHVCDDDGDLQDCQEGLIGGNA
jgi:hypothetical protein